MWTSFHAQKRKNSFKSLGTFLTSHVNDLLMFTSIKHHIICCIPDVVENCRTLKLLIHPQKLLETMNVVGGVCVEHNLPSLSSSLKDIIFLLVTQHNKLFMSSKCQLNFRIKTHKGEWYANPYDGHFSHFAIHATCHTCLKN
jgi:hypothetical protein